MKRIIVISGPSGSGKTTISKKLLKEIPGSILSISATTRKPRKDELENIDYFFVTEDEFKRDISEGKFLEWEKIHGNFYGTYKNTIKEALNNGKIIIMDIDPKGGLNVKKIYPEAVLIFLKTISREQLIERLKKRNTETSEDISLRMKRVDEELAISKKYDYIIENVNINEVIKKILEYVKKD